jgi:hypothetical protein
MRDVWDWRERRDSKFRKPRILPCLASPATLARPAFLARPARLARLVGNDLSSMLDSLSPMAPLPQHSARTLSHKPSFLLALLCLVGTACGTTAPTGKILFDDPRGTVSLQTMSDRSIQATHPITLEPTLLAQLLKGIEIQDQEHGFQKLLTGPSSPVPVFSDDQIRFLAPLLAEGLRTAAPDQRIEYRVHTTHTGSALESSTTETTAGSLYAYGRQLYVILSQYRYDPIRENMKRLGNMTSITSTTGSRVPDSSGLLNRTVLFTPSDAQRSDSFDPPEGGKSTDRFLAIDYQLLQHAPPAAATTKQTAPQMGRAGSTRESPAGTGASNASTQTTEALAQREAEIHTLKDLVIKNNSDVEILRKELESVQRRLDSQTTNPDRQKRKTTPPSKPQQTAP